MSKKIICFLLFLLISCNKSNKDDVTISLLHYFTGNLSSGVESLSDLIEREEDRIHLVTTPLDHEEYKIGVRVQLDSPNPPDLFTYWAGARTKYLVDSNKVEPITSLLTNKLDENSFDISVIEACSYNGELYLLPITRHYVGFFYNKAVFKKFGIEPPSNWNDLLKISETIKKGGITPYSLGAKNRWPAQFWFDYILLRTAGYDYRERLMEYTANYSDKEVKRALNLWKDLIDRDYFNREAFREDWDYAAQEVSNGRSAMTLMGTWVIPLLEHGGLISNEDYGFFPFPEIDKLDEMVSLGPIDGILLSKGSKHPSEAKEILYHLAKPETQREFNLISGAIAPRLNTDESIYNSIQLEIKDLIKKSTYWAFNYDLATKPSISEAGLNFFRDFLNSPESYEELLSELDSYITDIPE